MALVGRSLASPSRPHFKTEVVAQRGRIFTRTITFSISTSLATNGKRSRSSITEHSIFTQMWLYGRRHAYTITPTIQDDSRETQYVRACARLAWQLLVSIGTE